MRVLITGAGGLIGFEASKFFLEQNVEVVGIDNNMREYFFGPDGSIAKSIEWLERTFDKFQNLNVDIRNRERIARIYQEEGPFDLIIHTAGQPSHDWASKEPFTDFDINAVGTHNMLENFRLFSPRGVFILVSTNKVYGDTPNQVNLIELEKRYEYAERQSKPGVSSKGISEGMSIDNSTHSLFGSSKLAADILAQEYGRYFKLNVGIFRGSCLTGPHHAAVELHGFLSYIVQCALDRRSYTIFGYKGKQLRDQIHSKDVVKAFYEFYKKPKQGTVYNLGGGKENSTSILEMIDLLRKDFGLDLVYTYNDRNRIGDHICYYSDLSKLKSDYPEWKVKIKLPEIVEEIVRLRSGAWAG